jgi:membrane protein
LSSIDLQVAGTGIQRRLPPAFSVGGINRPALSLNLWRGGASLFLMLSLAEIKTGLERLIWHAELDRLPAWQAAPVFAVRLIEAVGRDLVRGHLTLYATSLVYTTLLSLVPLLAVSFSVLKGFGVHNQVEPLLLEALDPLGSRAIEVAQALIGYVDKTDVRVLGSVGLVILLYSVIALISKIEHVFNATWRVEQPQPLVQRISQYLTLLLIGPVLFVGAVGATASLGSSALVQHIIAIEPFGYLIETAATLIPLLLIVLAFTVVYMFVPNTGVRFRSALIGAVVAGLLWQSVGSLFAHFMAGSTRYTAIYSGLAIVILFMIWVYIAWLILLVGASIAFYHQYPEYLTARSDDLRLSNRLRERLALSVIAAVAERYGSTEPPWTAERLSHALSVPMTNVCNVLKMLESDGFLLRTAEHPPGFVPARMPTTIPVGDVLKSIRDYGEDQLRIPVPQRNAAVTALEQRLAQAATDATNGLTLADLAAAEGDGTAAAEKAGSRAEPAPSQTA